MLYSSKNNVKKFAPSVNIPFESVKGASTKRAQEISKALSSDVIDGINVAKEQALHLSVLDLVNAASRLQKIPQDFQSMQKYVKEQVDGVLKSKK